MREPKDLPFLVLNNAPIEPPLEGEGAFCRLYRPRAIGLHGANWSRLDVPLAEPDTRAFPPALDKLSPVVAKDIGAKFQLS